MSHLSALTLVDVVVLVVVVLATTAALRRRSGLLGATGAAVGALVLSWLVVVALATWGSPALAGAADQSRLLHLAPAPAQAVDQARRLVDGAH